jgi:hypothetical protein
MSERCDHSKNIIGIIRIQLFAKSFILQVYEVLARHSLPERKCPFSLIYATKLLLIKTGFSRDTNSLHLDALDDWTRQRLPVFRLRCACQQEKGID